MDIIFLHDLFEHYNFAVDKKHYILSLFFFNIRKLLKSQFAIFIAKDMATIHNALLLSYQLDVSG